MNGEGEGLEAQDGNRRKRNSRVPLSRHVCLRLLEACRWLHQECSHFMSMTFSCSNFKSDQHVACPVYECNVRMLCTWASTYLCAGSTRARRSPLDAHACSVACKAVAQPCQRVSAPEGWDKALASVQQRPRAKRRTVGQRLHGCTGQEASGPKQGGKRRPRPRYAR